MFSFFKERDSVEQNIAQLSSFSTEKRIKSAQSLAILIQEPIFRSDIIRLGGAARLARLLSRDGNEDVQEYALIALHNLACSNDIAAITALVQAGCISLFVRSLSDDSYAKHFKSKQQRRAAAAIASLAFKNPANQNAIAQAGAIKPLVHLLSKQSYPEIQRCSILALRNLALNNTKNQTAIAHVGGVQALVLVLRESRIDDNTTLRNAMSMLFLLTKDNIANQELILNYSAFQMLQHYSAAKQFDSETKSLASQILNYPLIRSEKYSAKLNIRPSVITIESSTHTSGLSSIGYSVSLDEPSHSEGCAAKGGEREAEEARQKERDDYDYRKRQVENLEFWKYQREMAGGVNPSSREDHYQRKIDKHDGSSDECRIS